MGELLSNLSLLILVIVAVINAILSYLVLRSDRNNTSNIVFSILGIIINLWLVAMYISLQPAADESILFWIRLSLFWAVGINTMFYFFSLVVLEGGRLFQSKWTKATLVVSVLVMLLTLSPFTFSSIVEKEGLPSPVPGPGIVIFSLYIISLTVSTIAVFIKRIKKSENFGKRRLTLILFGIISMLTFIVGTILLPVSVFGFTVFVPLFPVYTIFFTGTAAYTVVRHKMFNIKVIATEALTILLLVVLFADMLLSDNPSKFVLNLTIILFVGVSGYLLIKSVRNEVKQREQLEELTDKLKALDKQKDEFISMAAHELRAPMTAIKGYVSMLMDGDAGELSDTARDYLTDTQSVTERLIRLVNNMLNVGRIEGGRMIFKEEVVKLSEIVHQVFISFKFEAVRNNLDFGINIPEEINDTVYVDQDKLTEVVGNLVSNAVKYTERGRIDINVRQVSPKQIRVEVVDTGPGISKEEQDKLFQKFYRVESAVGKTIGTGLGLYISKLLIDKFGGEIGLESQTGKGSNFWFELPVITEDIRSKEKVEENTKSDSIKV